MHSPTFHLRLTVPADAIDANGHASNIDYLRWFQQAAIAHADAVGCSAATAALGATWVVRSHQITYYRPAQLGDHLLVQTWVSALERVSSIRHYELHRLPPNTPDDQLSNALSGKSLLATGQTEWIFIDAATTRPKRIPEEIIALFAPPPPIS